MRFTTEQIKLLQEIRSLHVIVGNTEYAISLYNDALAIYLSDTDKNKLFFARFMEVFSQFPILRK